MQENNMIDFLNSMKDMSSAQLSRLIQEETAKESPNDELVLMVLDILEDREKENPIEIGPKGKSAWKKYQSKVHARNRKTVLVWKPLMQVASVVLVITLLFTLLPTQANAETWWERLARWTDDFFSFFNHNTSEIPENEYVFQTDNEGLQQVYDAVVALGVTEPVVPMWIPEEYSMTELKVDEIQDQKILIASFQKGSEEIIFYVRVIFDEVPLEYFKDGSEVVVHEKFGIKHNILHNNDKIIVTWTKENIECSMSVDCQEEILLDIIESIYRWRNIN